MTERTVRVSLMAQVTGYLVGMEKAANATAKVGTAAEKLAAKRNSLDLVGKSMLAVGTIAAVSVGLAVSKFAEFDKAVSAVQASTHESTTNMGLLREAALKAGADTAFTATEAANAIDELAKAGISTADVLGGALNGSLDLAAAGELGVADAATIMATALTQFSLPGTDAAHVADLLAAGAGKAQGSVEDLAGALNQGGLIAAQTGLSIEETTGTLSAFASAGLLGSDAGTSFKSMLQRLTPQSKEAQQKMDELNISAYDAQGNFIGMEKFAGVLQKGLKNLTTQQRNSALATIFGSDAVRAASVLYSQGADGIAHWNELVNDSGYAAETARLKLDNLSGDVEALGGSFDTALIKSGSVANDTLRGLTQAATGIVNAFGDAPPVVQGTALAFGVLTAGVGILGGGFLTLVPKISAAKLAMQNLNITGGMVAKNFGRGGLIALGLYAVAGGIAAVGAETQLTTDQMAKLNAALKTRNLDNLAEQFGHVGEQADGFKLSLAGLVSDNPFENRQFQQGVLGAVDSITFGLTDLTAEMDRSKAQFRELGRQLADTAATDFPKANRQFQQYVELAGGGKTAVKQLLEAFPDYKAALIDLAAAQGETLSEQDLLNFAMGEGSVATQAARDANAKHAESMVESTDAAAALDDQLRTLLDTINESNGIGQDAVSANANYLSALAGIADEVERQKDAYKDANGSLSGFVFTIDESTAAGAENASMFADIAKKSQDAAKAQYELDGNTETYKAHLQAGRQTLLDQITGLTGSADAAQALTDKIYAIPSEKQFEILAETSEAQRRLDAIAASLDKFKSSKLNVQAYMRSVDGYADGGTIPGGTSYRDNRLAFVASGEEITRTAMAVKYRPLLKAINSDKVPNFLATLPRYANGGTVGGGMTTGGMPAFNIIVQSKGGIDLTKYIDVKIDAYDSQLSQARTRGARV